MMKIVKINQKQNRNKRKRKVETQPSPHRSTHRHAKWLTVLSYTTFQPSFWARNFFRRFSKLDRASNRHISSQDLAGSQAEGFGWGLSRPIPPVSRNLHSSSSISLNALSTFTHNRNANSSWNKNERFLYRFHHSVIFDSVQSFLNYAWPREWPSQNHKNYGPQYDRVVFVSEAKLGD